MNLNKVVLIGRLTQDPEVRSIQSGQTVATLRMATNRTWHDQASGQRKEATEYHTVVAWGRIGEIASQYLKRGGLLMVEGRLQTRSWDDKTSGQKRYMTEVVAENIQLGPRTGSFAGASDAGMADVKPTPAASSGIPDDIPIINENEVPHQGVEEAEEVKIKEEDLPF